MTEGLMDAALIDGHPATELPIADRGWHYGDGVFRTLRVHAGRAQAWPAHWQRLARDCQRLYLPPPDQRELRADLERLFADGGDGVAKIIVTRGAGGRGYAPPEPPRIRRAVLRYPLPDAAGQALTVGVSSLRLGRNPALAGVKHLNRLEQVLARREAVAAGWDEALMRDERGQVICGNMSNLFLVRGQELHTPELTHAGVIGATRQRLRAAAHAAGVVCRETTVSLNDCIAADELFLCNSVFGVRAIRAIHGHAIRAGAVHELTRRCRQWLEAEDP